MEEQAKPGGKKSPTNTALRKKQDLSTSSKSKHRLFQPACKGERQRMLKGKAICSSEINSREAQESAVRKR